MDVSSGKGVVWGRRGQQLEFALHEQHRDTNYFKQVQGKFQLGCTYKGNTPAGVDLQRKHAARQRSPEEERARLPVPPQLVDTSVMVVSVGAVGFVTVAVIAVAEMDAAVDIAAVGQVQCWWCRDMHYCSNI